MDASGFERGLIAVNPDADAGRTEVQAEDVVRTWLLGAGIEPDAFRWLRADTPTGARSLAQAAQADAGWSYGLLIAALVIALAELALARFFSHATVKSEGDSAAMQRVATRASQPVGGGA